MDTSVNAVCACVFTWKRLNQGYFCVGDEGLSSGLTIQSKHVQVELKQKIGSNFTLLFFN